MPRPFSLVLLLAAIPFAFCAEVVKPAPKPCSIHSPSSGSFYDLRPLQLTLEGGHTQAATNDSYHARGYDYPANFTLNFCGAVVETLEEVEGIPSPRRHNVSAYYKDRRGDIFSIGQQNDVPIFRGRKLVLNYTNGSPCPDLDEDGVPMDEEQARAQEKKAIRHKSTLLSFVCDTSPLLSTHPSISFIGSPDHCTYVFEVRSRFACPGATPSNESGTLGPASVFIVILGIALLVYLIGGCVYQRSVMHQRGWKQLPNYTVWAGLFNFVSDMFIIFFSSCTERMPSIQRLFGGQRGYHRVGSDLDRDGTRGRGQSADDENRLIDELDEEWAA